jgi:nucleoid DNA-binding protein
MANKLMSKSELIQKLAEKHADAVTRKDVKGVIAAVRKELDQEYEASITPFAR